MQLRAHRAAWWSVLALSMVAGMPPAVIAASGLTRLTDQHLPMAVRDGYVAEVTVHAVPFTLGSQTLDPFIAVALDAYLAAVATDCFLFAQAIGHVRPGAQADGDTVTAHRLARARSEVVNAALLRAGLPADLITSVWDYQFALRESRVTLWVFARPAGEDCAGKALPGAQVRVAVVPTREPALPTSAVAINKTSAEPAPGIQVPVKTAPLQNPTSVLTESVSLARKPPRRADFASDVDDVRPDGTSPAPQVDESRYEPAPGIHLAAPTPSRRAGTQQAANVAGTREQAFAPTSPVAVAAASQPFSVVAAPSTPADAEPEAGPRSPTGLAQASTVHDGSSSTVEIVFEPDSSYFASGAVTQLEELMATLPSDATWEFELQAAVGDKAGSLPVDQALAYNQWLADRRQGRVEEWLGTRQAGPVLRVRRSLLSRDDSRRVIVSARRLPRPGRESDRITSVGNDPVENVAGGATVSADRGDSRTESARHRLSYRQSGGANVSSFSKSALSVNSP